MNNPSRNIQRSMQKSWLTHNKIIEANIYIIINHYYIIQILLHIMYPRGKIKNDLEKIVT